MQNENVIEQLESELPKEGELFFPRERVRQFVTLDALLDYVKTFRIVDFNCRSHIQDGKVSYVLIYASYEVMS